MKSTIEKPNFWQVLSIAFGAVGVVAFIMAGRSINHAVDLINKHRQEDAAKKVEVDNSARQLRLHANRVIITKCYFEISDTLDGAIYGFPRSKHLLYYSPKIVKLIDAETGKTIWSQSRQNLKLRLAK